MWTPGPIAQSWSTVAAVFRITLSPRLAPAVRPRHLEGSAVPVGREAALGDRVPGEMLDDPLPGRRAEPGRQRRVAQEEADAVAQGRRVVRRDDEAGLAVHDELRESPHVA